jgi:hypothetical protein
MCIKTPHEKGGHSPCWAAEPEKIIIIICVICEYFMNQKSKNMKNCTWHFAEEKTEILQHVSENSVD